MNRTWCDQYITTWGNLQQIRFYFRLIIGMLKCLYSRHYRWEARLLATFRHCRIKSAYYWYETQHEHIRDTAYVPSISPHPHRGRQD